MDIISFPTDFNFDSLTLGVPNGLQGGSYFTKLYNNEDKVYLQSPSCQTKQGIVKTGKKMYVDLMFTPDNQNILNWFETSVEKVQQLIYEKRNVWFHNEMDLEDIESAFVSPVRTYKSGKYYLIRANINPNNFNVYDEDENPVNIELLNDTSNKIIPLIEILGVKFTSRSFQLEISLKQTMIIQEKNLLSNCLIKRSNPLERNNIKQEQEQEQEQETVFEKIDTKINNNQLDEKEIDESEKMEEGDNLILKQEQQPSQYQESILKNNELEIDNKINLITEEGNIEKDLEDDLEEDFTEQENSDNKYNLEEVSIDIDDSEQSINLKKPNEVYIEIWKEARQKAKQARKAAIEAYLEAKSIKNTYMLNEINNDSDDEFDDIIENLDTSENNQVSLA